jgi:hypothetical protein
LELEGNPAGPTGDDWGAFPERLGDDQPEAFANRLLDHDLGETLERVDLDVADAGEIGEDVDVCVVAGRGLDLVVDVPAAGIVEGHRADECELQIGHLLAGQAVGGDDAERVLPRIEPGDLGHERPAGVHTDPFDQPGGERGAEVEVLRALGVDGGWDDLDAVDGEGGRDEPTEGEDGGVRS